IPDLLTRVARTQESLHVRQVSGYPVARQRLQENFTIGHAFNPAIQQSQHAAIGLRANKAPETLLEGEDCLRHLKFGESVAAVFVESVDARGNDGIAGHGEGQTIDDDARELVAGNVNALPEAGS